MVDSLPVFPSITEQLFQLNDEDDIDPVVVARVIQKDIGLTANILKVANSPLYGQVKTIETIERAAILLGPKRVVSITLAFVLADSLKSGKYPKSFDFDYFFQRSLASATCARVIGQGLVERDELENLFIAGLLQDVGTLVNLVNFSEQYIYFIGGKETDHFVLQDKEKQQFGGDHAESGGWLLRNWNFPKRYIESTVFSHVTIPDQHPSVFSKCVAASSWFAEYWLNPEHESPGARLFAKQAVSTLFDFTLEEINDLFVRISKDLKEVAVCFNQHELQQFNEERSAAVFSSPPIYE